LIESAAIPGSGDTTLAHANAEIVGANWRFRRCRMA
jgi:hypothetical protein